MHLSDIIDIIIDTIKTEDLVNTITFEKTREIDYNKSNIFPLVNIDFINMEVDNQVLRHYFEMTVVSVRNENNHSNTNKIYKDNLIDNLNVTTYIASKIINRINMDDDLTLNNVPFMDVLKLSNTNLLDGVRFTLTVESFNIGC